MFYWHSSASISLARVESLMSCTTLTSIAQVTGCLPLPTSHCCKIFVLICSGSFWCLCMGMQWLSPLVHFCRLEGKHQTGWTWFLFPQECWLYTLPPVHVNLYSSCKLGFLPGLHAKRYQWSCGIPTLFWILACMSSIVSLAATWMLVILPVCVFISYHHASVTQVCVASL